MPDISPAREARAFRIGYNQGVRESIALVRTWKQLGSCRDVAGAYLNLLIEGIADQLRNELNGKYKER